MTTVGRRLALTTCSAAAAAAATSVVWLSSLVAGDYHAVPGPNSYAGWHEKKRDHLSSSSSSSSGIYSTPLNNRQV